MFPYKGLVGHLIAVVAVLLLTGKQRYNITYVEFACSVFVLGTNHYAFALRIQAY